MTNIMDGRLEHSSGANDGIRLGHSLPRVVNSKTRQDRGYVLDMVGMIIG